MKRIRILGALGGIFAIALASTAFADSRAITFEAPLYTVGSIQGQNGWNGSGIPINPAIDQAIVAHTPNVPAGFGSQSWRISNAYASGSFGDMPFSPSLVNEAGESQAQNAGQSGGVRQKHFEAEFRFASANPTSLVDTDSYVSISPDRGDGARMSYVRLEDHPTGMSVVFSDYQDRAPYGTLANPAAGCGIEDDWFDFTVSGLSRNVPHTVRLTMDFKDGPRNDKVRLYIDGNLRHTGGSWEDYLRWCTESGGGVPNSAVADQSRTVDSVLFRVGDDGLDHSANRAKGFLIDNLSYSSSRGGDDEDHNGNNDDHDNGDDHGGEQVHHGRHGERGHKDD